MAMRFPSQYRRARGGRRGGRRSFGCGPRLMIVGAFIAFAVFKYYSSTRKEANPFTGEEQRISYSVEEEIALGLQSAPQMAQQFGGLHPDVEAQATIDYIGKKLVASNQEVRNSGYQFDFHLLADSDTVNAFALPGGQIFFTAGLMKLLQNEDEVAGVLGHEIGHVVGRHSNEQMAKSGLIGGIVQGVVMGTAGDMSTQQVSAQIAGFVGNVINTKYGREDETQSDEIGLSLLVDAGYEPSAMLGVMRALKEASGGGGGAPEFMSSHPLPDTRIRHLEMLLQNYQQTGKTPF